MNNMDMLAKFAHYQKELNQFRNGEPVSMRRIELDPVAYCNHDCPFCIYRYDRNEDMNALFNLKDRLSLEKIVEIFDDCQELGIKAVEICGGGEPSLHPEFPDILKAATARGIEIGLITNGDWRSKHFEAIVNEMRHAVWCRFSLDAATPAAHYQIHKAQKKSFETAISAIEALVAHKTVDVGISYIVQKGNYQEIEDAYDLAVRLGVKYIRFAGLVFDGEKIDHLELTEAEHAQASEMLAGIQVKDDTAIINNFDARSLVNFERYVEGDTCYYSHLSCSIGADGKMYACCIYKYRPKGVVGDLHKERLTDIFRRDGVRQFFENFSIAKECDRCYLKGKNDLIHEFVNAKHINFV